MKDKLAQTLQAWESSASLVPTTGFSSQLIKPFTISGSTFYLLAYSTCVKILRTTWGSQEAAWETPALHQNWGAAVGKDEEAGGVNDRKPRSLTSP